MTVNTEDKVCSATYVKLKGAIELDDLAVDAFGSGKSLTSKLREIVKAYWSEKAKDNKLAYALIGHAHIAHARGGSTDPAFMVTKQMLNRLQKDKDADTTRPIISVVQQRTKGKDLEYVIRERKREATKPSGAPVEFKKPENTNNHKSKTATASKLFPSQEDLMLDVVNFILDKGRNEGAEKADEFAALLKNAIDGAILSVKDQATGKKAA